MAESEFEPSQHRTAKQIKKTGIDFQGGGVQVRVRDFWDSWTWACAPPF